MMVGRLLTTFLFGRLIFRGYVKFRGCMGITWVYGDYMGLQPTHLIFLRTPRGVAKVHVMLGTVVVINKHLPASSK